MRLLSLFLLSERLSLLRYFVAGVAVSLGYTVTVVAIVEWAKWTGPEAASAISFVLWTPASYLAHRQFTFRFTDAHGLPLIKYFVSFLLRLAASAAVVIIAINYFHLHYIVGVLMNWIVLPTLNYFVLKLWVFAIPLSRERHV